MRRLGMIVWDVIFLASIFEMIQTQIPSDPSQPGNFTVAQISVTINNPANGHSLATTIYYPSSSGAVDPSSSPYPTLVFSHGFQSSVSNYTGNATHLASWGYIVAVPSFSDGWSGDNLTPRVSDIRAVLSYLESENVNTGSIFYQRIDPNRFGAVGHSLGGAASLAVAGEDNRIKAVIALDPASGATSPFARVAGIRAGAAATGYQTIVAPALIIGTPASSCNGNAEYNSMYDDTGAEHKSKQVIANGSHCDFMDTSDTTFRNLCYAFCGGSFDQQRLDLAKKLTAAWLNYYLQLRSDYFTYIYGSQLTGDVQSGKIITSTFQTAPRGFAATSSIGAINLSWTLSSYPVITGYNVYRSIQSGNFPPSPFVQTGRQAFYLDNNVSNGQRYYYLLRSRDASGNEHQPSIEVSAIPLDPAGASFIYLPFISR
jgi:predicted dienelactone hydrolase